MSTEEIISKLSPVAVTALINFGGSHAGAKPPQGMKADVTQELFGHALVSRAGNLTVRGAVARNRALDIALRAL